MSKRKEAEEILKSLGLPKPQYNERSCLTLLALAGISEDDDWSKLSRPMLRILDIMDWMRDKFDKSHAPNSRETIRRQTIHQFEQARLIDRNPDNPSRPTNSGDTNYQLTSDAARVLRAFGKPRFEAACTKFIKKVGTLAAAYEHSRNLVKVPVTLPDGSNVQLSPGVHNELQKAIVEEFASRFAQGSVVVYLGDTAEKRLVLSAELLESLRIPEMKHDKLPDVVLYDENRNWLFLVEAVTSHGPISPKRHIELQQVLSSCPAGRVYVTAFTDFSGFKQYAGEIAWESEVWIAEAPDHLVHFDGERFLGPYPSGGQD